MELDATSFVLGAASGSSAAVLAWRARSRARGTTRTGYFGGRRAAGQSIDRRYARDLTSYLQHRHLAGDFVALTDILLEPRLLAAPAPALAPADAQDDMRDIFEVIPLHHDMPQSFAPYNLETLSLSDLGTGQRQVAILGVSGMGRSTALTTLALMALGQVSLESIGDLSEQAIREEEAGLSDDDRQQRREERSRIEARAIERLQSAHQQRTKLVTGDGAERPEPLDIRALVPILVDLRDIVFDQPQGQALDPSEVLVRAAQRQVNPVTARVLGGILYPALDAGRALVLLDGYDDLAPDARLAYFHWLREFVAAYGSNLTVIAGPVAGYEPLLTLGFAPTYLRPWRPDDYELLAHRWAALWDGKKRGDALDEQTMRRIVVDNRGRTILDVTLKIWAGLADDTQQLGRSGWYDAFIRRRLVDPEARELVGAMAAVLTAMGQPTQRGVLASALVSEAAGADGQRAARLDGLVSTLIDRGLLYAHHGDRLSFAHPHIRSFLAGEAIARAGSERATELALDPLWQDALAFAAASINMMPVVYRKLGGSADLLLTDLFDVVRWLPDTPADVPWRGDLFKRLAAALMAPDQYPEVRARAMAALIASRDKNVLFILRQALHAADADIRRLAAVGLGALGNPDTVADLAALLVDDDQDVKLAAALALGALGTDKAIQHMIRGLFEADHDVRRAIAEGLAAIPGEGHSILREAVVAQEIEIRRAAVYGLSRVRATWALVALYRTMLEDEQWYVRTAAEEAFLAAQSPDRSGPATHPEADSLAWLIQWAADRGEGVPAGLNARQVLIRVLQEGQPAFKILAARTLARLGHVAALKPLYAALRDRDPSVRGAAYEALASLQARLGVPLPGVL